MHSTNKKKPHNLSSEKTHPTYSEVFQAAADQARMHLPEFPSSSLEPF